ncbi:MAG: hypothetical protein FWF20_03560 [Betaproteobacteria bacterium]|nr:hypothetical protein [Betaproteobacteria bacterium]MCL2885860.1 hypothetical protein [Betaproteobacteria bacterium]
MKKIIGMVVPLALSFLASSASAGWYEVKNYVGTIGSAAVHVSLQTYDHINRGNPDQWLVHGSYYYDAYRIPTPLRGKRETDGRMVLCEAVLSPSGVDFPVVPVASEERPIPCPIALKFSDDGAAGEWNDGEKTLPIVLNQVGSLNDTWLNGMPTPVHLDGVVEIPMWYHTKKYLLLGIYESSADCPVSMLHLRLVNIATGRVDNDIPFGCDAGMIKTAIYANVSKGPAANKLFVEFKDPKMGFYEVVNIKPRAAKRK